MSIQKRRSLERITEFLAAVYRVAKVCCDFYSLIHGH
jgi:hypothetical protein